MPKPRYKTTNWTQYNKALINRGSLTFWIDEEAIAEWKQNKQGKRGRPRQFSDLAITTALMVKRIFSMPLRALQGFLDSVFKLANIPLVCPHYTCISRRAKEIEVSFKTKTRGAIQHLAIDATGLKVYGEGEWKVKKHGTDGKRRVWRKLHIAVDTSTHEIVAAELSLSNVTDAEVLPNLLKQTRRKIIEISGDGAYDTRNCHDAIRIKRAAPLIPPREGAAFWERGHPRNLAVGHYHDEKMGDSRTLVYLSGEHRTPIVLSVSISENLLSKDINFSLLNELTSAESELNMHYSDKLSVFYASLHEFLGGGYAPDEAFNKLIDSWGAFVALYQNNLSTYLIGFSFHKAKKEVAEAEIELSEKLTNLTSDIVFKLFSVPASVMALAAIMQKGQLDALVFVLLVIGVIVTILLMYGLLKSQKNKYESLEKAKDLVFSSIDGKEAEYPDELNTEITAMKSRLNKHFKSTGKWLGYYKVAIFSPLIALILFIIIA